MTDIVLYDGAGTPSPRRVKLCLIEKGLPFKIKWLNLGLMDQKSPEYLKISPTGLVPALVHKGRAIYESNVAGTGETNNVASIEAQVIADAPMPEAGKAHVRIVHLSADAPAVDIAPDGAEAIVADLAYPNATGYLALDPGSYDLEIRPAGAMDVAFDIDDVTLDAGTSYTVFAIGSLAGGTFTVLPAVDATVG